MEYLTEAHFNKVVDEVKDQVFGKGKGAKRHGANKIPLNDQTWAFICKTTGSNNFCVGQAIKKATELKDKPDNESYQTEILGAIVYLIFAKMWVDKQNNHDSVIQSGGKLGQNDSKVGVVLEKDKIKEFHNSYEFGGLDDNDR